MKSEELQIYKDTFNLCKILMTYSKNVSKIVRFGQYSVAVSKACTALDLVRRINSSFEGREHNLNEFCLLISEVNSRIALFTQAGYLPVKAATNLAYLTDKVMAEGFGWLKSERNRKARTMAQ